LSAMMPALLSTPWIGRLSAAMSLAAWRAL
jgi:hypothetical protein